MSASILMAEDHTLIVEGYRNVLEPRFAIVGVVEDGRSLIEAAFDLKPDLILLDITLPVLNGIDAAREIRRRETKRGLPKTKMLFVTMHAGQAYVRAALAAGADGYIVKTSSWKELLIAVNTVLDGARYIDRSLANGRQPSPKLCDSRSEAVRLSMREREVLQLTAEGKSRKEMAHLIGISEKTVAFHKANLKQKLGVSTTAELVRYALEEGIIS